METVRNDLVIHPSLSALRGPDACTDEEIGISRLKQAIALLDIDTQKREKASYVLLLKMGTN